MPVVVMAQVWATATEAPPALTVAKVEVGKAETLTAVGVERWVLVPSPS
jgi:hypothetical protein